MTLDFRDLSIAPKVRFLWFVSDEYIDRLASEVQGVAVEAGSVRGIYLPEQFKPVIADIRRQANGKA